MVNIPDESSLPEAREPNSEPPSGNPAGNMVPFDSLERFAKSFEASARRWELVVYPSMFAFIVLAAYGFILIYSLANDVAKLASSMDTRMGYHMASLATNMKNLTINIDHMSSNLADVATSMDTMTVDMNKIALRMDKMASDLDTMEPLLEEVKGMNESMTAMTQAIQVMTNAMSFMQRDTAVMGSSIGRPMSFMNSFAPW